MPHGEGELNYVSVSCTGAPLSPLTEEQSPCCRRKAGPCPLPESPSSSLQVEELVCKGAGCRHQREGFH